MHGVSGQSGERRLHGAPRKGRIRALLLAALASLSGCAGASPPVLPGEPAKESAPGDPAPTVPPRTLPSGERFFALEVPGFDPAIVFLPARASRRPPLVIVAHGAGVVPADICGVVRELFHGGSALLCLVGPRIAQGSEGRYFPDHFALERIFLSSLDALSRRHAGEIDLQRAVYAGYSQGATMGALMLPRHGDRVRRLLLIEGGFSEWSTAGARQFRDAGGERVLFACGTRGCRTRAETSAAVLRRSGVDARVIAELSAGHTYAGSLAGLVEAELPRFLEGDDRYSPGPGR